MMKLCFFVLLAPVELPFFLLGGSMYIFLMIFFLPQPLLLETPVMDFFSMSLVVLTVWLSGALALANVFSKNYFFLLFLLKSLVLLLIMSFFSSNFLGFYFFFEASLIPIFWIILGWGYQPERILASMMMFFYTMTSSLPLLVVLLLSSKFCMTGIMAGMFFEGPVISSVGTFLCFTVAFLVKFPMFLVHLWLPKAHVEAPVSGSMILAGVLLKLGGYGMFRFSVFSGEALSLWFMLLSAWGGSLLGILCCRLMDLKLIIAYSSVVHMALIIVALLGGGVVGMAGIWWVMIAHGLVSSAMFSLANIMYERSHSRSLLVNKGVLLFSPPLSMIWFIFIVMNFSGPFTLNLFGELSLIMSVGAVSKIFFFPVCFLTFFAAGYSLLLYSSSQHGVPSFSWRVWPSVSFREIGLLWAHMWPVVGLLASLNFFQGSQWQKSMPEFLKAWMKLAN